MENTVNSHMPIYVGDQVIEECIQFCRENQYDSFYLIADQNTYPVLGERISRALQEQGWDVLSIIHDPDHLHTDEHSLMRTLAGYDARPRLFISVGSGTLTDIARFTSHRTRNQFISFPTAASVDAYTSRNASVTLDGMKGSIYCFAPIAIFTDLPTICASPRFLTASGFGDSIGKFTSAVDWKFSHLLWNCEFDEAIFQSALHAARQTADAVEGIQQAEPASMAKFMDSLFESGFCMADFINSAPASGGEHHISHIWEMMFQWEEREGLYHGQAVGVATVLEAEWFEKLRRLSREEAGVLLSESHVPDRQTQEDSIRRQLPRIADQLIHSQPILVQLSDPQVYEKIKARILNHWNEIQALAALVPDARQMRTWLEMVGAPSTPQDLGLIRQQEDVALDFGLYLRERFSMNILRSLFGW